LSKPVYEKIGMWISTTSKDGIRGRGREPHVHFQNNSKKLVIKLQKNTKIEDLPTFFTTPSTPLE
jgi:hypothetical protein